MAVRVYLFFLMRQRQPENRHTASTGLRPPMVPTHHQGTSVVKMHHARNVPLTDLIDLIDRKYIILFSTIPTLQF